VLYPLIPPRLHGWLDDVVALSYIAGIVLLGMTGAALAIAIFGAAVHFTLTRITNYPQGTWKLLSFRTHAFVELGEGLVVLAATALFLADAPLLTRIFLYVMGASQLGAFAFSDYGVAPARAG
jgi:hypothetical protein